MSEATLVYPHQLFKKSPAITLNRIIYLIEEPLLFTENPIHRQRLLLHKLSMDAYQRALESDGHLVTRLSILEYPTTTSVFKKITDDGVRTIHVVDTTDNYLEHAIATSGLERRWYESPLFILEKEDSLARYRKSNRHLAAFYKQLRIDTNILLESDKSPTGGRWSFDADNRKKIPKNVTAPADITVIKDDLVIDAIAWLEKVPAEQYGETAYWTPYTHEAAESFLAEFLAERFNTFGPYEDAIHTEHVRLWHSTLSPLLNIGLLTPRQVIDTALLYATEHNTPLNSLEGFIRQILGWREFIRASYELDGATMRTSNFWKHTKPLPNSLWNGSTSLTPLDHSIKTALQYGYTHHIERLMVLGNYFLLTEINPDEVYRWFMGMYVDAYDWVMVPNVYGMSQFADGGSFATKPYISGSNYLKKMSNYSSGPWEDIWTALYWRFIDIHQDVFLQNHRLAMMPRLLEKMSKEKRDHYQTTAVNYLATLKK